MARKKVNIEIKAKLADPSNARAVLKTLGAKLIYKENQKDTYFNCSSGRLKIRESQSAFNLVYYTREDKVGPKQCNFVYENLSRDSKIKEILESGLGVSTMVEKVREHYKIGNDIVQIDNVKGFGFVLELELNDEDGKVGEKELVDRSEKLMKEFGISKKDLIACSNSDLVLARNNKDERTK